MWGGMGQGKRNREELKRIMGLYIKTALKAEIEKGDMD